MRELDPAKVKISTTSLLKARLYTQELDDGISANIWPSIVVWKSLGETQSHGITKSETDRKYKLSA